MDGEPIDEPVAGRDTFVMNSHAEAFAEYRHGLMNEIAAPAA
jgi:redox-sensitive bicupin YhaK (pirin superfamily)